MQCLICKKEHNNKKFCSNKCKFIEKSKQMKLNNPAKRPEIGEKISKAKLGKPTWNKGLGKKYTFSKGRKMIKKPEHHRAWSNGYVYESILVMEKKLGRLLKPNECVHHIDGNKLNNHPDNLQVMSNSEHISLHMTPEVRKKKSEFMKKLRKHRFWSSGKQIKK